MSGKPRVRIYESPSNKSMGRRSRTGERLRARRDANDTSAVKKLYVLRTYEIVRVHQSNDPSKYEIGSEWAPGIVVKKEGNNVWFGKDETFYVTSEVPKVSWYPDAMKRFEPNPLLIDHLYEMNGMFVSGLGRTFLFSPLESRGYRFVKLSEMTSSMNAALRGFVEGEMNKFFLRTLPKYNKSAEEMREIENMQMEITEYNDWYFADMAKQGVDVTGAPRKARNQSRYFWDYGTLSPSYRVSPSDRERPRVGKGPIRASVGQYRDGKRADVSAPRRLLDAFNRVKNRSPYVYVPKTRRAARGRKLSSRSPVAGGRVETPRERPRSVSVVDLARRMAMGDMLEAPNKVPKAPNTRPMRPPPRKPDPRRLLDLRL